MNQVQRVTKNSQAIAKKSWKLSTGKNQVVRLVKEAHVEANPIELQRSGISK